MFNFSALPFYDNHTHALDMKKSSYTPLEFSINYLHGARDVSPSKEGEEFGVSEELEKTISQLGVVKTMVCHLSHFFDCPATLQAVTEARNVHLQKTDCLGYAKELYADCNVQGCTVDQGWPIGDEQEKMFPGRVQRLYQMDPLFDHLMDSCEDYASLKEQYIRAVAKAAREGFKGIKCHVGERFSFAVKLVSDKDAEASYASALIGDEKALANVYFAIMRITMQLCQQFDIPLHIHTGNTGNSGNGRIGDCNPLLMCPYLNHPEFRTTKVVFLHASYPNIRYAALMTHMYPNVWMDISWTLPWAALDFPQILKAVLGVAPHNKVMLGTGQHGIPEMVWIAAKVAKKSLEVVMEEYVNYGFLTQEQAQETAEQVLYKNAFRLYGMD